MRLLVSVVDAAEARIAADAGADIIDVKDPSRGALGEAAPATVRAVRDATPAHLPVSAALGDGPFAPAWPPTLSGRRGGERRGLREARAP